MHIHEGAWAEENSAQNWGKDQQSSSLSWLKSWRSTASFHPPHGWGPWFPHNSKIYYYVCPLRRNQDSVSSLNYCFLTVFPSCIPLLPWRSLITETCSRARSWPDLDHRMALAKKKKKRFLSCQESHAWFSFSKNLSPHPSAYRFSDAF